MIIIFFALFFIPVYMRFKGSDELFYDKPFAFFLIWFSRIITFFLTYHIIEHFFANYGLYVTPLFAAYWIHRFFKERSLATYKFREKSTVVTMPSLESVPTETAQAN